MGEELEKMFADLRDYEWYTPFQEGVDELKAKVEEELKTSKQAELEKIKTDILRNSRAYREKLIIDVSQCEIIINSRIAELKGE